MRTEMQFPGKLHVLPELLTAELAYHTIICFFSTKKKKAWRKSVASSQIELGTFVSSSSVYWTANCFLRIRDLPSTNEGRYRAEKGFTCFLCQHKDRFTYFMDEKVPAETPTGYSRLSLGFYFSRTLSGGYVLLLLLVSELICQDSTYFTWLKLLC